MTDEKIVQLHPSGATTEQDQARARRLLTGLAIAASLAEARKGQQKLIEGARMQGFLEGLLAGVFLMVLCLALMIPRLMQL